MNAADEDRLTEEELLGQMSYVFKIGISPPCAPHSISGNSILVFAATDTTTSALAQTFHLLAQHPDVQEKLRAEIKEAKEKIGGEDIPHDELMALPYLDAVCRETLRV